jgi:hypothetical protein
VKNASGAIRSSMEIWIYLKQDEKVLLDDLRNYVIGDFHSSFPGATTTSFSLCLSFSSVFFRQAL